MVPAMDRLTKKLVKLLDCDYVVVEPQKEASKVMDTYYELRTKGQKEGFTPLIVVPGDELYKRMKAAPPADYYLQEYKKHAGADILAGYLDEIKKDIASSGEDWADVVNEVERGQAVNEFVGFIPADWDETLEVIIAKVPTINPWEVFAWLPMGGFSECPPTEYIISIMKKWYQEWEFVPAVICEDMIEGFAPKKPEDAASAIEIATEHYAFCPDLIEQCCGDCTIGQWADCLLKSDKWFFWWE